KNNQKTTKKQPKNKQQTKTNKNKQTNKNQKQVCSFVICFVKPKQPQKQPQLFLVVFGCFWLFLVVFGCFWLFLVVFGCFLLFLFVFGCVRDKQGILLCCEARAWVSCNLHEAIL